MMINRIFLVALASLVLTVAGCSRHSPATAAPKTTDWGIVEVADGIPSNHRLADGRTCVLTPTLLPGGRQIELMTSITNTNAAGTRQVFSLTSYFSPDQATTFVFDTSNVISLTLHVSK